jgi:hypothetical protein
MAYGEELQQAVNSGTLRVAYAQVALSAVNVVVEYMRGDRSGWLLPSKTLGVRRTVRLEAPIWIDRAEIQSVVERLRVLQRLVCPP